MQTMQWDRPEGWDRWTEEQKAAFLRRERELEDLADEQDEQIYGYIPPQ